MARLGIDIGGSSVKVALAREGVVHQTARSSAYAGADLTVLTAAMREALNTAHINTKIVEAITLSLPGVLDDARTTVAASVNLPALVGVPLSQWINDAAGAAAGVQVISDANAAALDIYVSRRLQGRLLLLAIGTGVGAAVIDDGAKFLSVDGDSPGHFGQLDVSLDDAPPIGPDGGAGSLEAYISSAALISRYGASVEDAVTSLGDEDPAMKALARAIRIAHALYRPHHVCLAGGIGIRMGGCTARLQALTRTHLTRIARQGWTLSTGDSDFHAARGAALFSRS